MGANGSGKEEKKEEKGGISGGNHKSGSKSNRNLLREKDQMSDDGPAKKRAKYHNEAGELDSKLNSSEDEGN